MSKGFAESEITINGKDIKFKYVKDANGKYTLEIDNGVTGSKSTHKLGKKDSTFDVKKLVAKTIEEARQAGRSAAKSSKAKNDQKMDDLIKQVRKLKRQGFLQKGGTITDVNTTISEFLSKQK